MIARLVAWVQSEASLLSAHSWDLEDMSVQPEPSYQPCSSEDPRCAETIRRLAECRERMKRMKSGVLDGRPVTCSASTDIAATIRRARAVSVGPVRMVSRKGAR